MSLKFAALAFAALGLTACAQLNVVSTAAAVAVGRYCDTPQTARLALREVVAARIAPNRIVVECAGDQLAGAGAAAFWQ